MEIRPVTPADLDLLSEIDGTIQSHEYLHVDRGGDGLAATWRLHERPLRERMVRPNPIDDDRRLAVRMIATGADDGLALMCEHDGLPAALAVAVPEPALGTLRLVELRVDYDVRRQGLASGLLYAVISAAREQGLRAVSAATTTDNMPAARVLARCGFEVAGLDERRTTNHDLVKEAVTLFWYASLD